MRVDSPFSLYLDLQGALLDAGSIYVGAADSDPEASPLQVYWDSAYSLPALQPLKTRAGKVVNDGVPSLFFVNASDYSLRVRDADGNEGYYVKSTALSAPSYQPLDTDLSTIAGQANQPFGLSLLTAATAVAARALLGISNWLATTGGTMSGDITRQGGGVYQYHIDPTFVSGRKFYTAAGASDPTSEVGDEWWQYAP